MFFGTSFKVQNNNNNSRNKLNAYNYIAVCSDSVFFKFSRNQLILLFINNVLKGDIYFIFKN